MPGRLYVRSVLMRRIFRVNIEHELQASKSQARKFKVEEEGVTCEREAGDGQTKVLAACLR